MGKLAVGVRKRLSRAYDALPWCLEDSDKVREDIESSLSFQDAYPSSDDALLG